MGLDDDPRFTRWLDALERRHMRELTFTELRRGLQALSTLYVQRPGSLNRGSALRGAGKRAAFAVFYGPLHFLATRHVVRELGAAKPAPHKIHDLGCGTGVAGAGWAVEAAGRPFLLGVDLHPWAVEEARWTWEQFGLRARASCGRLENGVAPGKREAVIVSYVVNELAQPVRQELLRGLLDSASAGGQVLVLEPIARRGTPWWDGWKSSFVQAGGRADSWRFPVDLPQRLRLLDRAAGLDHRELTARSLYLGG